MRISDKSKLPPNKSLLMNISSYCWQSNSYGLFDYHSTSNSEVNINGYGSFHLIHDGNNIVPKRNLLIDDNQVMHIAQSKQKFYVSSTFVELNNEWVDQISSSKPFDQKFLNNIRNVDVNHNHQTPNRNPNSSENLYKHQMWSVIRNTKPNNHGFRGKKLEVDDVLKVGRYILKVVKISSHHKNEPVIKTNSNLWRLSINEHKSNKVIGVADNWFESHSKQKIRKTKTQHWNFTNKTKLIKENDIIWRIWLSDIWEEGDSFISPCGWSGTMKYIHSSWLKSWLNSNKDIVEDEYWTTTRWNIITCELWKQQFDKIIIKFYIS